MQVARMNINLYYIQYNNALIQKFGVCKVLFLFLIY